jgi:hypothetical protein
MTDDKSFVGIALLSAKSEIAMGYADPACDYRGNSQEKMQQRHRVRTTRDRNKYMVSADHKPMFPKLLKKLLFKMIHLRL